MTAKHIKHLSLRAYATSMSLKIAAIEAAAGAAAATGEGGGGGIWW